MNYLIMVNNSLRQRMIGIEAESINLNPFYLDDSPDNVTSNFIWKSHRQLMKNCILFFWLVSISPITFAQVREPLTDSTAFYRRELMNIRKAYQDSLRNNSRYQELNNHVLRLTVKSDSYNSMVIFTQFASADFKRLNADHALTGFSPVSGNYSGIGYGFSFKRDRRIFDLTVAAFGIRKKSKREEEIISTGFSGFFQFEWGYDLVKSKKINFYPYAGFGLRGTSLEYKAKTQLNPNPGNITNIVQADPSVSDEVTEFGYQAGLGLEFVLTRPTIPGGVLVFIKGGTNRPFKRKGFSLEGYRYDPRLDPGNWIIAAGFKFFGR